MIGLQCIIVPPPRHADAPNYARTIMNFPQASVDIWIRIPVHFKDVNIAPNMNMNTRELQGNGKLKNSNGVGHDKENKKRKLHEECYISSEAKESDINDTSTKSWTLWDNFRHTSNSDKRVYIALEFFNHEDLVVCTEGML